MIGQHYLERYYGRGFGAQTARRRIGRSQGRGRRELAIAAAGTAEPDPFLDVTP
jgi:polar amino acid transport system permease protein